MKLRFAPLIIGSILLFNGCTNEEKNIVEEEKTKIVKVLDLNTIDGFSNTHKYPALVHSFQDSNMAFEVSGKIIKFYYNEGEQVKKGSVIAKLDDTIYKANYNSALANYNQSKLDYKRYKSLYESRSIAKRDLEQVKQTLDVNRSNFNIAKKKLEDTKLIAEFDGIMAKKLVKDFERITEKQAIIRLQDNSAYKVKFFAPENDILGIKERISKKTVQENVDFFVSVGSLEKKIPATFMDISTTAEEISRTFEVTLKIETQKDINILPGMTSTIEVLEKNSSNKTLFLPLSAVFTDASNNSFIWLVDTNNKVKKQKVTTGRLEKDSIEIKEVLKNNSKVVISGVRFLKENDQIKVYKKIGN